MEALSPEVNEAILRLFSAVAFDAANSIRDETARDTSEVEENLLLNHQVVIKPEALYAAKQIEAYVKKLDIAKSNSWISRLWIELISKKNTELVKNQLIEYMSIHHKLQAGSTYIPATAVDPGLPDGKLRITVFGTLKQERLKEKCWSLLSGMSALSHQTILDCTGILDWTKAELDISKVRNSDARTFLIARHLNDGNIDCEPEEILRAAVCTATGELRAVNSPQLLASIKSSDRNEVAQPFESYGITKLASIFNRYKPFFMAFKLGNSKNVSVINCISRRSKQVHKPLPNLSSSVAYRPLFRSSEYRWLETATIATKLRALKDCHWAMGKQHGSKEGVRGKFWISDRARNEEVRRIAKMNFETILNHLKETIGDRFQGKRIYIPGWIKYGFAMSEKQFIGNVPFGTEFTLREKDEVAVGIFWDQSCRCKALKLSSITVDGRPALWDLNDKNLRFEAPPAVTAITEDGASEYIVCRSQDLRLQTNIFELRVNCCNGDVNHEYDIIIGSGSKIDPHYMMDPANRKVNLRYRSQSRTSTMGLLLLDPFEQTRFILWPEEIPDCKKDTVASNEPPQLAASSTNNKLLGNFSLNDLLAQLGAKIVRRVHEGAKVDFDLSLENINRSFFDLFK